MKQDLALFDFDNTITTRDTFLKFISFVKGKKNFFIGLAIMSPWLIAYKLKLIPNWQAKEKVIQYFFKGTTIQEFNAWGEAFCEEILPTYLRKDALERIKFHFSRGDQVYVISASAENWVKPWTDHMNIPLICTKLEFIDDKLSGKISGKNCYGEEKVSRLKELEDPTQYDHIYAYGDSSGDSSLLNLASKPFYRVFK